MWRLTQRGYSGAKQFRGKYERPDLEGGYMTKKEIMAVSYCEFFEF